jgi:cytosine/adenosine deaminase-related metal-dependent hydrolase
VAEDAYDVVHSHHRYHEDIASRLDRFGLLDDRTLLVHGLYMNEREAELVNARGSFLAHNPRSNMNNHVGIADISGSSGISCSGPDGAGQHVRRDQAGILQAQGCGRPLWPADFVTMLARGNTCLSALQGTVREGRPGYKADLTILDYQSPTPWVDANAPAHVVWGTGSDAVDSVMVDGKLVMEHRQFGFDVEEIPAKAAQIARRVWHKVDAIAP